MNSDAALMNPNSAIWIFKILKWIQSKFPIESWISSSSLNSTTYTYKWLLLVQYFEEKM